MIHRAILGSVERFIAILTEHLAAEWPLWLSPRQICLVPVTENFVPYCEEVKVFFKSRGFDVEVMS